MNLRISLKGCARDVWSVEDAANGAGVIAHAIQDRTDAIHDALRGAAGAQGESTCNC